MSLAAYGNLKESSSLVVPQVHTYGSPLIATRFENSSGTYGICSVLYQLSQGHSRVVAIHLAAAEFADKRGNVSYTHLSVDWEPAFCRYQPDEPIGMFDTSNTTNSELLPTQIRARTLAG